MSSPMRSASPMGSEDPTAPFVVPMPTTYSLEAARANVIQPSTPPEIQITWCRDALLLLGQHASLEPDAGPYNSKKPSADADAVLALAATAATLLTSLSTTDPEAAYWHAILSASGVLPSVVPHDRPAAFRDFETSAKAGFKDAWFKLGADYEAFGDNAYAVDCFKKGAALGAASCSYRLGMAHLFGELDLPQDMSAALGLLYEAALAVTLWTPYPAYQFALILLGEFTATSIPPHAIQYTFPNLTAPTLEAKAMLERAASLHYVPAQYKLGSAYEVAQDPWPYDPQLSVEWYRLAGTREADLALSRWFLCGAEDVLEKDEVLALRFAHSSAAAGLPDAEFAMGYYAEIGVGQEKNLAQASEWYQKAAVKGHAEAQQRLQALKLPEPNVLSRSEHETLTNDRLVRRRTHARDKSDARSQTYPLVHQDPHAFAENVRKQTISEGMPYPELSIAPMVVSSIAEEESASPPSPLSPVGPMTPTSSDGHMLAPQFAGRTRYSLVDPGCGEMAGTDSPPRSRSSSPTQSFRPPGRRSPTNRVVSAEDRPVPGGGGKQTTFADMGFGANRGAEGKKSKTQDKGDGCVVM